MSTPPARSSSVSLRSVSVVTVLSFGQMVILFVLQLVSADLFGTSVQRDAYLAAYAVPFVVGGILSTSVGTVMVTLRNELLASEQESTADVMLAHIGFVLVAITAATSLVIAVFAEVVIHQLFADFPAGQVQLSAELLRILCWLIPLNCLTGFMFGIEHARGRFTAPAVSGTLGPGLTVVFFLWFSDRTIQSLAISVVVGTVAAVGMLILHFPHLRGHQAAGRRQAWRRFGYLILPLFVGAAYSRLDVLVDRMLADELPDGSMSQLGYAWSIATSVIALGTSGLSVVAFPSLAQHAATREWELLQSDLNECWRFLAVVAIPMLGGIVVCGRIIITAIFEHGAFTAADTAVVSRLLWLYCGVILAAGIGEIAARTFYAMGKMWIPTLIGMLGFTLGTILKVLYVGTWGVEGLAAITSLYFLFNVTIFLVWLSQMGLVKVDRPLAITIMRSVAASILAIGLATAVMSPDSPIRVLAAIATAVTAYVLSLAVLGDEFARRALKLLPFSR